MITLESTPVLVNRLTVRANEIRNQYTEAIRLHYLCLRTNHNFWEGYFHTDRYWKTKQINIHECN